MAALSEFRVTVVDPREALTRPDTFPGVTLVSRWPADAFTGSILDPWTDVAVLAHDERLDVPALAAALRSGCRYVGLLGGRRTQRLRREALRQEGIPAPDVDRIRGPIGLDIGARAPAEIAIAILAQILAERLGGSASAGGP
jgi:xanthine dehydrogenase accessory factor